MTRLISVIVPTYNEKDNIVPLVEQVHSALSKFDYEIIFVDDNSGDGTAAAAEALSAQYPVKVFVRKDERGLASAVIHGFGKAEGEFLAVMDADIQHPPDLLETLLETAKAGADLVIASRYVKGGSCEGWSLTRRIVSRVAMSLAHLFLPQSRPVADPLSGCFLFRKSVINGVVLKPTGYKILLEIIVMGNYKVAAEVPYTFHVRERGKSKLNARQQWDYLKHILSLMRRTGELIRFLKFCLVGISGVVVNLGLLFLLVHFAKLLPDLSNGIAVEVSILTNFTFNFFFTFSDRIKPGRAFFFQRLGQFNLVSLVSWAINQGIFSLLTRVFNIYYLLASIIGIAVATIFNYLLNIGWTWKQ